MTTLIAGATDVNELAFAMGALAHYAADANGHPLATNRVVPLDYPKLREKFGSRVTYAQSPKTHVIVEFSFDVVQVASGVYASEAYHKFIGFEVAMPALERAFRQTYGLELRDLFADVDLAIGTYRHAVSSIIPEMTKVAWRDKREQILKVAPKMREATFVFHLTPRDTARSTATGTRSRRGGRVSSACCSSCCRRSVRSVHWPSKCRRRRRSSCF